MGCKTLSYLMPMLGPAWGQKSVWAPVPRLSVVEEVIQSEELTWHTAHDVVAGTLQLFAASDGPTCVMLRTSHFLVYNGNCSEER